MGFMQPEIFKGEYWLVENDYPEVFFIPYDVCPVDGETHDLIKTRGMGTEVVDMVDCEKLRDFIEGGEVESVELHEGVLGRLSAPGYMDCTDWTPYDSEGEALAELQQEDE